MPPDTVHYGRSTALTAQRGFTLDAAFAVHPARFKGVAPRPPSVPLAVWINPPKKETTAPIIKPNCSLNS
jgi:putative transposase